MFNKKNFNKLQKKILKVAVIIPTYNRINITKKCIQSILNGNYEDILIVICDSNSSDGTNLLFHDDPRVSILNVGSESWWSGAVNRGIIYALKINVDCIVIMNDDIDFDSQLICKLVEKHIDCPSIIISPSQHTQDGIFLGTIYTKIFKKRIHVWRQSNIKKVEIQTSNGCCLLIPPSVFKNIGLFDEINCPHLAGDFEFQIRAAKLGYKTYAFPDIEIFQQSATDYYRKISLFSAFTFKGSPILFSQYIAFGKQLFGGLTNFIFLGIIYHMSYVYSIIKIISKNLNR